MNTFTVAAANLSVAAVKNKPNEVFHDIVEMLNEADFVLATETGMATKILKRLEANGYYVYQPDAKPGQKDTAIISVPKPRQSASDYLTPATNVGDAGAGPSVIHAKWLNRSKYRLFGRTIWLGVLHTTPSIYIRKRYVLARTQFSRAGAVVTRVAKWFILGGDLNSEPGESVRDPLQSAGMTSTQTELGILDTMNKRSIDDQYYTRKRSKRKRKFQAVKHWTKKGVSDHRYYFTTYEILPSIAYRLRHALTK